MGYISSQYIRSNFFTISLPMQRKVLKCTKKIIFSAIFASCLFPTSIFPRMIVKAAAPPEPETIFTVLAAGERTSVLAPTTENNTTNHNGSEWYNSADQSMGFAPGGESVVLSSADVNETDDPYRLSWHLSYDYLEGGYRAGSNTDLNDSTDFSRFIYEADSEPSYYPSGPQIDVAESTLTGWTLCYQGYYGDDVLLTDLWTTCDGDYLLLAGAPDASNKIDVEYEGSSILNAPGGTQLSTPRVYETDVLDLYLYESDGYTLIDWSDFVVYVSTCTQSTCSTLINPLLDGTDWDSGTHAVDSYTIPSGADYRYLAIVPADDATYEGVEGSVVYIAVSHIPVERTISDCDELQAMQEYLSDNYTLTQDIDCYETETWNEGDGFDPIGGADYRFEGSFDGAGHTISGLYIDRESTEYVGLFGVVEEGSNVRNVGLIDVDVTGYEYVGALVGGLSGTVENSYSTGEVNGYSYAGGLVGQHIEPEGIGSSSLLLYSWNGQGYEYIHDVGRSMPRNVVGDDYTQLDGDELIPKEGEYSLKMNAEYNEISYYDEANLMTIDHAPGYSVVTTKIRAHEGELYTFNNTPSNPLQSCTDKYGNDCLSQLSVDDDQWSFKDNSNINYWEMNFGNLSGASKVKFIIEGAIDYTLEAAQSVKMVQVKDAGGNWVDAYTKSEISSLGGAPRKYVIDMTGKFISDNYDIRLGFDRTRMNYVAVDTSADIPYTVNEYHPTSANLHYYGFTSIDKEYFWDHDYYSVSDKTPELYADQIGFFTKYGEVSQLLQDTDNQYVITHFGDQIDLEFEYEPVPDGQERSFMFYNYVNYKHSKEGIIGRTVEPLPFKGMSVYPYSAPESYPMTPENVNYLNTWNTRYIDGSTGGGSTIIDSHSDADVDGYYYIGGLVGYNGYEKLITGSYATGDVYVYDEWYSESGGFVGVNEGEIEKSFSTGSVYSDEGSGRIGGFVGANDGDGTISQCYALGSVEGDFAIGGFSGGNGGYINNSFSRGDVNGYDESIGGFSGRNGGVIEDCYTTSEVYSEGDDTGAFVGHHGGYGPSEISISFWDEDVAGGWDACGNTDCEDYAEGRSTEDMKNIDTFTTELGEFAWDFETIWGISEDLNDGYPFFIWVDGDSDSVMNSVEQNGPNNGDANDDQLEDYEQSNVASFLNEVNNAYTALEVPEECTITSVTAESEGSQGSQDAGYDYPAGLVDFTIDCGTPGFTADVSLYFYGLTDTNITLRKYFDSTSAYTTISGVQLETLTIGGEQVVKATYQVVDGGDLDLDLTENAIIVDPVGGALLAIGAPSTGFAPKEQLD